MSTTDRAAGAAAAERAAGLRPISELDAARDVWPRGRRLQAVRDAGLAFKSRFKAQGTVRAARSVDLVTAPYPSAFAFHGAVRIPTAQYISITNRMVVVQYEDFAGDLRILVWEPTVPEGSAKAPFFAQTGARIERIPGGKWLTDHVLTEFFDDTHSALTTCGLQPEDVDFASFDHLHVQDLRMIMGTTAPIPGERAAREPLFPRAAVLAQDREVATLEDPHPMQLAWYVPGALEHTRLEQLVRLQGSVELGIGVAIVWTPGHTDGNHSLVINTPDGVWVSSENGVALDNWQPERSKIPGVAKYASFYGREIVPNANTLEDAQDQYDSMVLEKTLADPRPSAPEWLQVLPSSELTDHRRQWPVHPTHRHGGFSYGSFTAP